MSKDQRRVLSANPVPSLGQPQINFESVTPIAMIMIMMIKTHCNDDHYDDQDPCNDHDHDDLHNHLHHQFHFHRYHPHLGPLLIINITIIMIIIMIITRLERVLGYI